MQLNDGNPAVVPTLADQARYWDEWNAAAREDRTLNAASLRQAQAVEDLVAELGRNDLSIIDVGCGTGWLCERLSRHGTVVGTDMVETVLHRARHRWPHVRFICGNIFDLDLPAGGFDVVVSLEVLSHVEDQPSFMSRLASLLKPGGRLVLATQNRPIYERWRSVAAAHPAQLRRWVNAKELRALMAPHFRDVGLASLCPVGDGGFLRIVNSPKLNGALGKVVPKATIERLKERMMLGNTLLTWGTRR
jgi:2-polyprenyl-3-methyl-5-hydroxy-6-metoxy-1,4-benzoquinol methylase